MQGNRQAVLVITLAAVVSIGLAALVGAGMEVRGLFLTVVLPPAAGGILAGAARIRFRRAPEFVGALVILAYAVYVLGGGVWAVRCVDCDADHETTRAMVYMALFVAFGVAAGVALLGIWAGARLSWYFSAPIQADVPDKERQ